MNQTITKINVAPSRQQNYGAPESTVLLLPKSYDGMNGFTECYQKRKGLFSTANILVINTKQTCY